MPPVPPVTLLLTRLAALFTLITVGMGGVVCATKSGFDCHAWPGCYPDRFAPGASDIPAVLAANPALEMIHRVTAMTTGGLLIAAAIAVFLLPRQNNCLRILSSVACLAAGGSALFGRASVLGLGVDAVGAAIDLLCALLAMALSTAAAVLLGRGGRLRLGRVSSPALLAASLLVVLHVSAHLAAGNRSFTRCLSWPILWLASDDVVGMQVFRTILAVVAAVVIIVAVRAAAGVAELRPLGLVVGILLAIVVALAVAYRAAGVDGGVLGVTFSLASVGLLWTTIVLAAHAAGQDAVGVLTGHPHETRITEPASPASP